MVSNDADKDKCSELKGISSKLQIFFINAVYADRKRIDEVRTDLQCLSVDWGSFYAIVAHHL